MLYKQGDLAEYPCSLCPRHIMPEPDETTLAAQQIYHWMAQYPFIPDHPPDLTFLFRLAGIKVGSRWSQEVYARIATQLALEREHRKAREGEPSRNGQRGDTHT